MPFPLREARRVRPLAPAEGSGAILLFTGVRYERHPPETPTPTPKKPRGSRR